MNDLKTCVNFYILPDSQQDNRYFFVFRLVEKAFEQKIPCVIVASDEKQLRDLDKLIWTAKPARFIAHDIFEGQGGFNTNANIVLTRTLAGADDWLSTFAPQIIIDLSYDATPLTFPKIMLVANQHAEILANARMKYQAYVNADITPRVYKINEKQLAMSS